MVFGHLRFVCLFALHSISFSEYAGRDLEALLFSEPACSNRQIKACRIASPFPMCNVLLEVGAIAASLQDVVFFSFAVLAYVANDNVLPKCQQN